MPTNNDKTPDKVGKLIDLLRSKRSLLIVMQDNPDPDSIASAAALRRLARSSGDVSCSIAFGGVLGRSENRALAEYLGLNFRQIETVDVSQFDAVAIVDTQPGTGNNSLPEDRIPDIVLDHHPIRNATRSAPFTDVRSRYGALSTILFEYLEAAGIRPEPPLATALVYAIRADTQDLGTAAVSADIAALEALYPLANKRMLSQIQRGPVGRSYFRALASALERALVRGPVVYAFLDDLETPDLASELADLLLRYEEVDWSIAGGFCRGTFWLSLRTASREKDAGEIMRRAVRGLGTGGGHAMSAGGQIRLGENGSSDRSALTSTVRDRLLKGIGVKAKRSVRLARGS